MGFKALQKLTITKHMAIEIEIPHFENNNNNYNNNNNNINNNRHKKNDKDN